MRKCLHFLSGEFATAHRTLFTLQVPMQPTGLAGLPLKPSFLLMARKRYALKNRDTQTTHKYIYIYVYITLNKD